MERKQIPMKVCPYCGSSFSAALRQCPFCGKEYPASAAPQTGAVNYYAKPQVSAKNTYPTPQDDPTTNYNQQPVQNGYTPEREQDPLTIEELQVWYEEHNLPPQETTRFFIGRDLKERRAFGIFRAPDGCVTVYKNKNDGTRAVRYRGYDEAFAVHEFLTRLRQEISSQKNNSQTVKNQKKTRIIFIAIAAVIILVLVLSACFSKSNGYYRYGGDYYYYSHNTWFVYYPSGWTTCYDVPYDLEDNWRDYYQNSTYDPAYAAESFTSSDYYRDYIKDQWDAQDERDSWSSSDSWDSGGTDFDSDW